MIRDYSDQGNQSNILVYVTSSKGGDVASKLIGRFVVNEIEFRFTAIAFGRIGGHNIHLHLSKRTINTLRKNGHDPDAVLLEIQRKLIEGDIIVANDTVKDSYPS
jgi:hypothetical protein